MSRLAQNGGPILVTGGKGQLATSLVNLGGPRIRCVGRPDFDFDKPETIVATLNAIKPVAVVNAAAWTAVDLAESEQDGAARANATGPEELARLCAEHGIPLIHVSTDYVFSGDKGAPYVETDPVSPETVYGRTKAEGESKVLAANPKTIVLVHLMGLFRPREKLCAHHDQCRGQKPGSESGGGPERQPDQF